VDSFGPALLVNYTPALTDEAILPNNTYWMSGNRISVKTLDLNCNFEKIAAQLDAITSEYFGENT